MLYFISIILINFLYSTESNCDLMLLNLFVKSNSIFISLKLHIYDKCFLMSENKSIILLREISIGKSIP